MASVFSCSATASSKATDVPEVVGQAVHGSQRLGVFGTELGLHEPHRLFVEREGSSKRLRIA